MDHPQTTTGSFTMHCLSPSHICSTLSSGLYASFTSTRLLKAISLSASLNFHSLHLLTSIFFRFLTFSLHLIEQNSSLCCKMHGSFGITVASVSILMSLFLAKILCHKRYIFMENIHENVCGSYICSHFSNIRDTTMVQIEAFLLLYNNGLTFSCCNLSFDRSFS